MVNVITQGINKQYYDLPSRVLGVVIYYSRRVSSAGESCRFAVLFGGVAMLVKARSSLRKACGVYLY